MPSIYEMVNRKLNKHPVSHRKSMTSKKKQVVVLRPSMRSKAVSYVRRGATRKNAKGFLGGGLSSINGLKSTLIPYATALGMGTIFVAGASKIAPNTSMQNAQMIGLAGEFIGGGFKGLLGAEVIKVLVGAPSILSGALGLFGGQKSSSGMVNVDRSAWA